MMNTRGSAAKRLQSSQITTMDAKHKIPSLNGRLIDLLIVNPQSPAELKAQLNAVPFHLQVTVAAGCDISIFEATAEKLTEHSSLIIDPGMPGKPGTSIEKILGAARKLGEGRGLELPYNIAVEDLPKVARELQGKRVVSFQPKNTPLATILGILPWLNPEVELFIHPRNKDNIQSKDLKEISDIIQAMKADTGLKCSQRLAPWINKISKEYFARPALSTNNAFISTSGTSSSISSTSIPTSLAAPSISSQIDDEVVEIEDKISAENRTKIKTCKNEIGKLIKNKKHDETLDKFNHLNNLMQTLNNNLVIFEWISRSSPTFPQQLLARVISLGWMDIAEVMLDAVPKDKLRIVFNRLNINKANDSIKNEIAELESKMQLKSQVGADSNSVSIADPKSQNFSRKRAAEKLDAKSDRAEPKRPKAIIEDLSNIDDIGENLDVSYGAEPSDSDISLLPSSSHVSIIQQLSLAGSAHQQYEYQPFVDGWDSSSDHLDSFPAQKVIDEHSEEHSHLHDNPFRFNG